MQLFGTSALTNSALAQVQAQAQAASSNSASSTSSTGSSSSTNSVTSPTDALTSESTFLQLLIAQVKNQDPLNPTDSIQFVGQLVQYSELEQLMGINQGVQTLTGSAPPTTGTSNTSPNGTKSS